jgi:hypothetical protein
MQHQFSPITQDDAKHLVCHEAVGRELNVEWISLTHRAVEYPGGKIANESADQALQGVICCCHGSAILTRGFLA